MGILSKFSCQPLFLAFFTTTYSAVRSNTKTIAFFRGPPNPSGMIPRGSRNCLPYRTTEYHLWVSSLLTGEGSSHSSISTVTLTASVKSTQRYRLLVSTMYGTAILFRRTAPRKIREQELFCQNMRCLQRNIDISVQLYSVAVSMD